MGKGLVDGLDLFQDAAGDFHRVGIGLFADPDIESALAVDAHDARLLLVGVPYVGDLAQPNGGTLPLTDDRVANLVQAGEFGRRPQGDLVASLLDLAGRQVEVGVLDGIDDLIQGQTGGLDALGVQFDANLPVVAPEEVHLGHARDAGKAVADLVFDQFGHLHRIEVAGDAQDDDRKTGDVEFAGTGADDIVRQFVDFVFEFALNVDGRRVDVGAPHEADAHRAAALRRGRRDFLHAGHHGHDLLDDAGHQALHHLGTGPLVVRPDGQGGQFDIGQHVDLQAA